MRRTLVTGAGGFIGHHLVKRLKAEGFWVRGVDLKYPEFEKTEADEFKILDLREWENAEMACFQIDDVYQLAALMGGIGFITKYLAEITRDNVLININMLEAAKRYNIKRYLYTSSACVYNQNFQNETDVKPLKEEDAWPALPEEGYGLEKLFSEKMCEYYAKDYGLDVRIVRFHNVYGPLGTYDGGKEKSPAALCRKIAKVQELWEEIEIWGDGKQTRTYMYISDCVEGLRRLMESNYQKPLNLGTNDLMSIDALAYTISLIANKPIRLKHIEGPQGVRGRSSDNTKIKEVLDWEPTTPLSVGLKETYEWIEKQVKKS